MNNVSYNLTLPKYKELKYFLELRNNKDFITTDFSQSKIKEKVNACYLIQDKPLTSRFSYSFDNYCAKFKDQELIKEKCNYNSGYFDDGKLVPVIRDKNYIKMFEEMGLLEDGRIVSIGRMPKTNVEYSLKQELDKAFINGTLLFTESGMNGYPEFYYNGNTYVANIYIGDTNMDGYTFDDMFKYMKIHYYDHHGEAAGFNWFKVEDIYFVYLKKYNILISSAAIDVYNHSLLDVNHFVKSVQGRIISYELQDEKSFLTINDYANYDKIEILNNRYKSNSIDVVIEDLKSLNPSIEPKKSEKDGLKLLEFGEYPTKVIQDLPLEGKETGKIYHIPIISQGGFTFHIDECKEYYDSKHNIKYAKIGGYNYIIEPLLWGKNILNSYVLKNFSFGYIDNFNYHKYIIKYFLREIMPSKVKNDVHEVINSNIGYQLLMNKNNINETDLELDDENRLVLKK